MANKELILQREDGTEARILALDFTSYSSKVPEYDLHYYTRKQGEKVWNMITDTPERREAAKTMSVDQFVAEGRNPIFYLFSFGEIFKAISLINNQYDYWGLNIL